MLHVRQGKTAAKLRIEVTGELAALLGEIEEFKHGIDVYVLALLVNKSSRPLRTDASATGLTRLEKRQALPRRIFSFLTLALALQLTPTTPTAPALHRLCWAIPPRP